MGWKSGDDGGIKQSQQYPLGYELNNSIPSSNNERDVLLLFWS